MSRKLLFGLSLKYYFAGSSSPFPYHLIQLRYFASAEELKTAENLLPDFDLGSCQQLLVPAGTPIHPSGLYYTVNILTKECFLCPDYLRRGPKTDPCKHVKAAEICSEGAAVIIKKHVWLFQFLQVR